MSCLLSVLLLLATLTAACAADDPAVPIPTDALDLTGLAGVNIDIQDNSFVARVVVVSAGTTVTWTNQGRNERANGSDHRRSLTR